MLCDLYFAAGQPVPFSTRHLYRTVLAKLAAVGYDFMAGLEVEFHVFKLLDPHLRPGDSGQPGEPPEISLLTQGYQYLTEQRYDQFDQVFEILRRDIVALGLRLRSIELEYGPSQCEFTFHPGIGLEPADAMVLLRSAVKQIARRHGYHASFMCRPRIPNVMSSGWHLHQSLRERRSGTNAFVSDDGRNDLSPVAMHWLAGLLAHLGPRQSRRDDSRAGRARRSGDAAGEPGRRASGQSLSLHGLAGAGRTRRARAQARSGPVSRHALRDRGRDAAQVVG
jgi:glutamine synthetase